MLCCLRWFALYAVCLKNLLKSMAWSTKLCWDQLLTSMKSTTPALNRPMKTKNYRFNPPLMSFNKTLFCLFQIKSIWLCFCLAGKKRTYFNSNLSLCHLVYAKKLGLIARSHRAKISPNFIILHLEWTVWIEQIQLVMIWKADS